MEILQMLGTYGMYLVTALVGMVAHFLKKKVKGESMTEIKDYFRDHVKSTALALISTLIGFVILLQLGQINSFFAAFGIGYLCDSGFNKWDNNAAGKKS